MASTPKRGVKPTEKPGTGDKSRGEFATMAAGATGEGSPSKAYSNRSKGPGYVQVTSTIGNK